MAIEKDRRNFLGMALGGFTTLGGIAVLGAAKRTWDPLPSIKTGGFTTIDLSSAKPNVLNIEKWRGKPIFIIKQSKEMIDTEDKNISQITGKTTAAMDKKRLIKVGGSYYMVCIGLCTHLGCIPGYRPDKKNFLCACHGGMYDDAGMVTKSPPPRGLDIPPFKIDGNKLVLGEEGPEYKKLKADGVTL